MLCWGCGQAELCGGCDQSGGEGSDSSAGTVPCPSAKFANGNPTTELTHSLLLAPLLLLLYRMVQQTPCWHLLSSRFFEPWGQNGGAAIHLVGHANGGSPA